MDKKRTVLHFILQYIGITIASIMYAMALAWFLNPNQLAPGGVSGIAIVLKEIFPFLPGIGALILISSSWSLEVWREVYYFNYLYGCFFVYCH